jgi:plasmid segregation protein ParM
MIKKTPVFRALDLGFGFTKFTKAHYLDDETVEVASFPSFAAPAVDYSIGAGVMSELSIVNVAVADERFAVGKDVRLAADGAGRQMLESTFFRSSQYLALARGAMAFMKVPDHGVVDALVIGLPINVFRDQALIDHVETKIQGIHLVPDLTENDSKGRVIERQIHVKKVQLIPQVLGSLVEISRHTDLIQKIQGQQNLTIDVGYGTLLWLMTDGFAQMPARSNGNMGGVSSLLQKVVRSIDPNAATSINVLERLDKALLGNNPSILVNGEEVQLAKFRGLLTSAARENLTEMLRSIGNTADVDNVFLTGGGAHLYREEIGAAFPKRKINVSSGDSRYTNVRGFQYIAETEN